jgi:hypothetical protein
MVFGASRVPANPRLETEDPFLPMFYPETEFSSDVDRQNSVTSKPFSGQSHMGNG